MQKTDGYDDNLKAESYVIQQITERWHVGVAHLGEPYYGGDCLVDPHGRILAWLRIFRRKELKDGLKFDIRRLTQAAPFLSASGRPLVLVARFSEGLRYAMWKPGLADFILYRHTCDEQTEYAEFWDAIIPADELRPLGWVLPLEIARGIGGRGRKRPVKRKGVQWRNIIEVEP